MARVDMHSACQKASLVNGLDAMNLTTFPEDCQGQLVEL